MQTDNVICTFLGLGSIKAEERASKDWKTKCKPH